MFQFKDPMIGLLLASALVSILMRQFDDAFSITAVFPFSFFADFDESRFRSWKNYAIVPFSRPFYENSQKLFIRFLKNLAVILHRKLLLRNCIEIVCLGSEKHRQN